LIDRHLDRHRRLEYLEREEREREKKKKKKKKKKQQKEAKPHRLFPNPQQGVLLERLMPSMLATTIFFKMIYFYDSTSVFFCLWRFLCQWKIYVAVHLNKHPQKKKEKVFIDLSFAVFSVLACVGVVWVWLWLSIVSAWKSCGCLVAFA